MVMVMVLIPPKGRRGHVPNTEQKPTANCKLEAQSYEPYSQEGRSLKASGWHRNHKRKRKQKQAAENKGSQENRVAKTHKHRKQPTQVGA